MDCTFGVLLIKKRAEVTGAALLAGQVRAVYPKENMKLNYCSSVEYYYIMTRLCKIKKLQELTFYITL